MFLEHHVNCEIQTFYFKTGTIPHLDITVEATCKCMKACDQHIKISVFGFYLILGAVKFIDTKECQKL